MSFFDAVEASSELSSVQDLRPFRLDELDLRDFDDLRGLDRRTRKTLSFDTLVQPLSSSVLAASPRKKQRGASSSPPAPSSSQASRAHFQELASYLFRVFLASLEDPVVQWDDLFVFLHELQRFRAFDSSAQRVCDVEAKLLVARLEALLLDAEGGGDEDEDEDDEDSQGETSHAEPTLWLFPEVVGKLVAELGRLRQQTPPLDFGGLLQLLQSHFISLISDFVTSPEYELFVQLQDYMLRPVSLQSFSVYRVIGKGRFGKVFAVQKQDTRAVYALKEINKEHLKSERALSSALHERAVLAKLSSPFLLSLKFAFQSSTRLYLLTELCGAGTLRQLLHSTVDRRFPEEVARFYAAELLLALADMHELYYIHRDVKPENVLLTREGHVKLCDMGVSVRLRPGRTLRHRAGTRGYWAPEIFSKRSTSAASDVWSWAVVVYEMIAGRPPQCACNVASAQWCSFVRVSPAFDLHKANADEGGRCHISIDYPPELFSAEAQDLLQSVFCARPEERLSVDEIKSHAFFQDILWERLSLLDVAPPMRFDEPLSDDSSEEQEADAAEPDSNPDQDADKDNTTWTAEDEERFANFTYISRRALQHELVAALQSTAEQGDSAADADDTAHTPTGPFSRIRARLRGARLRLLGAPRTGRMRESCSSAAPNRCTIT